MTVTNKRRNYNEQFNQKNLMRSNGINSYHRNLHGLFLKRFLANDISLKTQLGSLPDKGTVGDIEYSILSKDSYSCNEKDSGYYIDQLEQLDSPYFIVITSGSKTKAGAEISIVDIGMDGTTLQILVKEKDASKGDFVSPYSPCCVLEVNEAPSDIQIHNINGKVFNPIEG